MSYISKSDLENLHDKKWREYKNLHENGNAENKEFARHAMLTIRAMERDVKEHFSKHRLF